MGKQPISFEGKAKVTRPKGLAQDIVLHMAGLNNRDVEIAGIISTGDPRTNLILVKKNLDINGPSGILPYFDVQRGDFDLSPLEAARKRNEIIDAFLDESEKASEVYVRGEIYPRTYLHRIQGFLNPAKKLKTNVAGVYCLIGLDNKFKYFLDADYTESPELWEFRTMKSQLEEILTTLKSEDPRRAEVIKKIEEL